MDDRGNRSHSVKPHLLALRSAWCWVIVWMLCACATPVIDLRNGQSGLISFPSSSEPVALMGRLTVPSVPTAAKRPAVIIVHSSGGLGAREEGWARFLQSQGYATFEIDYFTPRGIRADSATQPSPTTDIFDAQRLLSTHPAIDPTRIAVIGFSRGGLMALEALNRPMFETNAVPLAAHVSVYGDCQWPALTRQVAPVPVLILAGELDDTTPASHCELLVKRIKDRDGADFKLIVYPGAAHGWSGTWSGTWYHVAGRRPQTIVADPALTARSYQDTAAFLAEALRWPRDDR